MNTGYHVLNLVGDPPPLTNKQERMHYMERDEIRKYWAWRAYQEWERAGKPRYRNPRIVFSFFFSTNRHRDTDNLSGCIKPLLDGLKGHMFKDDDAITINLLSPNQFYDKNAPRSEIHIEGELVTTEEAATWNGKIPQYVPRRIKRQKGRLQRDNQDPVRGSGADEGASKQDIVPALQTPWGAVQGVPPRKKRVPAKP